MQIAMEALYGYDDLVALSEALACREANAVELTETVLTRIDQCTSLNCFVQVDAEGARAAARESAERLANKRARSLEGVPVAVKDNLNVTGLPTRAGMVASSDRPAVRDAETVARLRAAGAVIMGKLNMNEGALGADGRNPHFGDCRNPSAPGRAAGGSSGGSAAAVAAGLVAATLGSDTMGSVRIPAAYCGVWGLKPSFGLISTAGSVPVARRLDTIGPLARSGRDLQRLLSILAGYDPNCPVSRPLSKLPPAESEIMMLGLPCLSDVHLQPAVATTFEVAIKHLVDDGWCFTDQPAPPNPGSARRAGLFVCEAEMLDQHADAWHRQRPAFSQELAGLLGWAERRSAAELAAAHRRLDSVRREVQRWISGCDVMVLPTTPQVAFDLREPTPVGQADLTCLASAAGLPAATVPVPADLCESGPVGLQLIGSYGDDRRLLTLAHRLAAALSNA